MIVELAAATARTPRAVYREESYRTLFVGWMLYEKGRNRPLAFVVSLLSGVASALPGGRASRTSEKVREAAKRGGKPPPGGEVVAPGVVRIHIDDPGAAAAYRGSHPSQVARSHRKG